MVKLLNMKVFLNICVIILLHFSKSSFGKIQCMDQNNNPVDWYVVFKLPKLHSSDSLISNGEGYMYITSDTLDQGWTWSSVGIQDESTLLANTLRPYYTNSSKGYWVLYNDQNPKYGKFIWLLHGGHTKGLVGADDTGGMWMVHSIPKYPPSSGEGYGYPGSGFTNGQSALCMTLSPESINDVGKALGYNDPEVYDLRMGPNMFKRYPDLVTAAEKTFAPKSPWYINTNLRTVGGTTFSAFAKSKKFGKDLYELVGRELQTDLLVETWQNVFMPLKSSCSENFKVMNIKEIGIQNKNLTYESKKDHSKWAVGRNLPWTCIGDINRAKHQMKRGGGTVCINNQQLWKLYNNAVVKLEEC